MSNANHLDTGNEPTEDITEIVNHPERFLELKNRVCERFKNEIDSLTPEELIEKWNEGRKEHRSDLSKINAGMEFRNEVKDAVWYQRIEDIQLRLTE